MIFLGVLNSDVFVLTQKDKVGFLKKIVSVFEEFDVDYWLEFGTLLGCYRDNRLISWDSDLDFGVFDIDAVRNVKSHLEKKGLFVEEKPNNFMPTLEIKSVDFPEESYFHADVFQFVKNLEGGYEYNWLVRTNIFCRIANYISYFFRQERVVNASKARVKLTDDIISVTKKFPKSINKMLHSVFFNMDLFFSHNRKLLFKDFVTKPLEVYGVKMRIPETVEEHLLLNYGKNWQTPMQTTQTGGCEFISEIKGGVELCRLPEEYYE